MKLVTAVSMGALVLGPAVALAQAPANGAGDTQDESTLKSKLEHVIGKVTGGSPDTKEGAKEGADAKSGAAATNPGNTNYPDRSAVKKTDK